MKQTVQTEFSDSTNTASPPRTPWITVPLSIFNRNNNISTMDSIEDSFVPRHELPKATQLNRAVWSGRILFLVCLAAVAIIFGILAKYYLSESERSLAEKQFGSMADRALLSAHEIVARKRLGTVSLATVISVAFPNASSWPFVALNGYEVISNNIIATSSGREMGVCPIIDKNQITEFEEYAHNYYTNDRLPPFPNNTGNSAGESEFGFGIWARDESLPNTTDQRVRVVDGKTNYNGKNEIITPVLQHSNGADTPLMLNSYFEETRGNIIDSLLDCASKRKEIALSSKNKTEYQSVECTSISDFLYLVNSLEDPGALIMQPIYPYYDDTLLTGFIVSSILWEETLKNIFTFEISGVDCVLSTKSLTHTYHIQKGKPTLRGVGDIHDRNFDKYGQGISLTGTDLFSSASAEYHLTLYPTEGFFKIYSTYNPMVASIGAVCVIIFTSLLFILYDYYVRQEFSAKRGLLEAKRQFMRFVSHEVRTPLNSVSMGLTLLKEEIEHAVKSHTNCCVDSNSIKTVPAVQLEANIDTLEGSLTNAIKTINNKSNHSEELIVPVSLLYEWIDLTSEIFQNAQAAVAVLNDMLNYDKIEMGNLHLELTVIPIWNLFKKTADEFNLAVAQKKINYVTDFNHVKPLITSETPISIKNYDIITNVTEVKLLRVVGDSIRLAQCIRNLLSNALKFTPENGTLTVRAMWIKPTRIENIDKFTLTDGTGVSYSQNGFCAFIVSDSGAGMSEGQLSQLFRDGVQFHVNELQGGNGTGLGLHISKGIVKQHRGTLAADSAGLLKGSTLTMTLPVYHVPASANPKIVEAPPISIENLLTLQSESELNPLRILIVDDSTMNRKLLQRHLKVHGHRCHVAENGQEALDRFIQSKKSDQRYDSILIDNEMPVMNGPTAVRRMRALGCDSYVVGITGNILPEDVAYFKRCGANAVLPKPFNYQDLQDLWVEYGMVNSKSTTDLGEFVED